MSQTAKQSFETVEANFKAQGAKKREYSSDEYWVNRDRTIALIQPDTQTFAENSLDVIDIKPQTVELDERESSSDTFKIYDLSAKGKTHSIQQKYIKQIEELTDKDINLKEHARMNTKYHEFPVLIDVPNSEVRFIISPAIV